MQATTEDPSTTPSGSEFGESFTDVNNSLTIVLQNLTTTLSQLTEASQAQTAALADLKEDLLVQDEADEPYPDRPAELLDIAQLNPGGGSYFQKNWVGVAASFLKPLSYYF